MGFDKHFYEDHCYMDDATNDVAMNVEIIEDNSYQVVQHLVAEKPVTGYTVSSISKQSEMSYQTMMECETLETEAYRTETEYCTEHSDLLLLEDEKLVEPGDKFSSLEVFVQYLNENAKRWCFYYKCSDSHKQNVENEYYTYNCVYLKNKEKYKKKGIRKRINNKTDCPCKIRLRRLPNEKELTVVYVCNHHDHELSLAEFCKLQHGRRLPPYVKEEIMDLLALQVDKEKIRNYVEMETGLNMGRPFFYGLEKNMQKTENYVRHITEERFNMLNEKIAAVDEMYGYNDDKSLQQDENYVEDSETPHSTKSTKSKRVSKKGNLSKKHSAAKNRPKTSDEVVYDETLESVKNLEDLVKCEIQKNPWVPEQCVPVLPNRTSLVESLQEIHSESQGEAGNISYQIQLIDNDFENIISDGHDRETSNQNEDENIVYETVVTDTNEECVSNETEVYCINGNNSNEEIAVETSELQESNYDINGQNNTELEQIEYVTENDEQFVQYIDETNEENTGHDVGVQTNKDADSEQTLLPVFDVYMKDGNVMGFVVNNNVINALKDGVDKEIQTSEDIIYSDTQEIESEDSETIEHLVAQNRKTYTKHEYIHKYNIDQYMTQPNFPTYVQMLAKETDMDVLHMFTNIYNETAMFKLTTTQKGKDGNTRIRYITQNGKIKKRKADDPIKQKFGKKLQSIFILKEKMRMMKKYNQELLRKNEYLQDVALKLVNMG